MSLSLYNLDESVSFNDTNIASNEVTKQMKLASSYNAIGAHSHTPWLINIRPNAPTVSEPQYIRIFTAKILALSNTIAS